MSRPLDGIRLLEWASFINGPGAGYMLGDLGAEVVKIEQPGVGDPARGSQRLWDRQMMLPHNLNLVFETFNRNKRGVAIDITKAKGLEVFYALVKRSDVFYTNYREGLRKRLGIDYQTLCKHNPQIIYVVASGYGAKGEDAEKRAFDVLVQARSGLMMSCGDRDSSEPYEIVGAVVDQLSATMTAYAILAGLLAKERTGIGQEISVSMLGSAIHLQALNIQTSLWRGRQQPRHSRTRSGNAFTNSYRCADGKWIELSDMQYDRFWDNVRETLGLPENEVQSLFATPDMRRTNNKEFIKLLDSVFAQKPRQEWVAVFKEKAQFAWDIVNSVSDAALDPQTLANNYVTDFHHPVLGDVKVPGSPFSLSKMDTSPRMKAPELGEHTEEVLLELGYTWEDIAQMKDEGVT
ncbi:MAG TPA: CoA transferase [Dehalococcoidia bacterium]|jgi:crotonobetainyl-CoA:carnitine CoA-transferase CaiB-like acyl-CoA transferase|nr:CoA transferase [Dehalococcoidia bacterium]